MKQGEKVVARLLSKKLALFLLPLNVLVSFNLLTANLKAHASYDSFLYGPDAKMTMWDEPFSPADLGPASYFSAKQNLLNQNLVDLYLAHGFMGLVEGSAEKKRLLKLCSHTIGGDSLSSQLLSLRTLPLSILALLEQKQTKAAQKEGLLLQDLLMPADQLKAKRERAKTEKSNEVCSGETLDNLAKRFARAEDNVSARYLQKASAQLRLVVPGEKNSELPSSKVEELYLQGVKAAELGNLEEAQAKLKQAIDWQDKTMNDKQLRAFDSRLALAQTFATLDNRELAQEYYHQVVDRLKQLPKLERPQTADLLAKFLRLLEVDLNEVNLAELDLQKLEDKKTAPPVKAVANLSPDKKARLLHGLNSLGVAAYLCKIDGDLVQAAHLFRRAYLINKYYFPELDEQLASTCYDLGETLFWASQLDEAEYYMEQALKLREKSGRDSDVALNLRGTFGRILILGGRGQGACRFYIETLRLLAGKSFAPNSGPNSGKELGQATELTLSQLLEGLTKAAIDPANKLNPHFRSQYEDALQSLADAAISCRQYDQAIESDTALLFLREQSLEEKRMAKAKADVIKGAREQVVATLWQLGWITSMAGSGANADNSSRYFSRLIEEFPSELPRPLADWYQSRAISSDLLGRYGQATNDFKAARKLFKKHLLTEKDQEQKDIVTWTIDDIKYNLDSRRKSPATDKDYLKAEANSFWRKNRRPIKVFVETSPSNGFAGQIRELMLKAMEQWTKYDGSPVKLYFVSDISLADVYIERVTSYDDIPYGSAGRTSAIYENDNKRALARSHVRVYCPSFDGEASHAPGAADKIENQEMSTFARTQLYTLFMHEFGHVLGLGHSPGGQDVMYWKSCSPELTERDKETVRRLYRENP